jgi:hypothetical protein
MQRSFIEFYYSKVVLINGRPESFLGPFINLANAKCAPKAKFWLYALGSFLFPVPDTLR